MEENPHYYAFEIVDDMNLLNQELNRLYELGYKLVSHERYGHHHVIIVELLHSMRTAVLGGQKVKEVSMKVGDSVRLTVKGMNIVLEVNKNWPQAIPKELRPGSVGVIKKISQQDGFMDCEFKHGTVLVSADMVVPISLLNETEWLNPPYVRGWEDWHRPMAYDKFLLGEWKIEPPEPLRADRVEALSTERGADTASLADTMAMAYELLQSRKELAAWESVVPRTSWYRKKKREKEGKG